ncbi:MAG: imidazole glycerol phosphate synthase subunit HisH [Ghiorsea sp.]|nr:imidazole glycerol phosphate synthase subunit HisH [Ghiorsea sp.]
MTELVGVVNYGIAGNVHSVRKALEKAGGSVCTINNPSDFKRVGKLVIPGVGSFKDAMRELKNAGMLEPLKEAVSEMPTLGICLGMQILASLGFEYGKSEGLCVINAEVKPVLVDAKVPHMGFNTIKVVRPNELLKGLEEEEFYFMHSYEFVNYTDISSLTEYAGHKFVSSIHREHVYGVQFHPEKSRRAGISLFKNFLAL